MTDSILKARRDFVSAAMPMPISELEEWYARLQPGVGLQWVHGEGRDPTKLVHVITRRYEDAYGRGIILELVAAGPEAPGNEELVIVCGKRRMQDFHPDSWEIIE